MNRVYQLETRDALLGRILVAADRIRKSVEAATSHSRCSQPSGSLCCGRRRHFRKPSLSTEKFKLKVISRSYLYIYNLNVSCIMLVYYFVPFIVSNRYLLFWVSNGHNSVTVQNRTHVYMNFFHHKDLGNHLLQLCPKVVKHAVYVYIYRQLALQKNLIHHSMLHTHVGDQDNLQIWTVTWVKRPGGWGSE